MSFINRTYTDIVQDVLTTLTSGVSQERHTVDYDPNAQPLIVPDIVLKRRPVKRVSYVSGLIETDGDGAPPVPYTFTLNDYELVPDNQDREAFNTIRFLPFGNKPAPGTDVVVNYYPRNTDPAVVTDLNVGSVIRTLVEALSKELAILYTQLNLAYDSGFLETASGSSLDRVVALLGEDYERFRAGRPVGTVRFSRRAGSLGNITIPVGTPITDTADKIRYETVETHTMLAGESTAEVRVRGASQKTPPVEPGILVVIQKSIAGVDSVTNDRPTTRANDDESDGELRERARGALLASNKGTVDAIRFGLLQMSEVRDVKIDEMPNGVPGEIRLSVSLNGATPPGESLPKPVLARIEELRPAGIRVIGASASSAPLQAQVNLVLAGSHLAPAEIEQIHAQVRKVISGSIEKLGVGQKIRLRPLVAAILGDQRIVDAAVSMGQKGGPPRVSGEDFEPPPDAALKIDENDITFGPDAFDQPLTAAGQPVGVEVRAVMAANPVSGTPIDSVKTQITNKLNAFFASLAAGTEINMASLLTALRDDAKYAIDPLRLQVTLVTAEQFVQIVQGGRAFQVQPNQTFTVVSVEVTA